MTTNDKDNFTKDPLWDHFFKRDYLYYWQNSFVNGSYLVRQKIPRHRLAIIQKIFNDIPNSLVYQIHF